MKQLSETIRLMQSDNYKDRFKAEYYQTKIRYEKLNAVIAAYESGTLSFTPSCSLELLNCQKECMKDYIRCLKIRAKIEGICVEEE